MKKIALWIFALAAALSVRLDLTAADLELDRAVIVAGAHSNVLDNRGGAYLEYLLRNRTDRPQRIPVMLRSQNNTAPDAFYSMETSVPAHAELVCRMLVQLDSSAEYYLSSDRADLKILTPDIRTSSLRKGEISYAVFTDKIGLPGIFIRTPAFHNRAFAAVFASGRILSDAHVLEQFRAVLISGTDFSRWPVPAFAALEEYVRNGGTLCVVGTEAGATPLDALLPLTSTGAELDFYPAELLGKNFPAYKKAEAGKIRLEQTLLRPGARALLAEGSQILAAEKTHGKGVVRMCLLPLETLNHASYRNAQGELFAMLLEGREIPPRPQVFTHRKLQSGGTGFSFPQGMLLYKTIAFLCAGLLVLAILCAFFKKRWIAWCVLFAFAALTLLAGCVGGGALFRWVPIDQFISDGNSHQQVFHHAGKTYHPLS